MSRKLLALPLLLAVFGVGGSAGAGTGNAPGQSAPLNAGLPTIDGNAAVGQGLTASPGLWSGPTSTYAYSWLRCAASCSPIASATSTGYSPVAGDAGYALRVSVTATNKNGSTIATSDATSPVAATPPQAPPPSTSTPTTTTTPSTTTTTPTTTTATTTTAPTTTTTTTTTTTATTTTTTPTTTTTSGTAPTESGRWYAATSTWNKPIPANPPIAADNAAMTSNLAALYGRAWIGPTSSSTPSVAYASATTPTVTVQRNYPTCNAAQFQIPIPAGTKVEQANESHLVVVGADGTEWDMFKVTPPSMTPLSSGPVCAATSNWAATVIGVRGPSTGWQSNADTGPSYRGSNTAAGAGTIRQRDLATPNGAAWDHALALAYPTTASGATAGHPKYVYPATGGDGTTSGTGAMPEGARIQLDPSINCNTWPSLASAPAWKKSECKTLQIYGAIVVDTGAGLYMEWYKDHGTDWATGLNGFSWADTYLPQDLYGHFRVIDWTQWTG